MMRKIFLDVGAADGSSVRFFRGYYPEAYKFEIYCFEPLPDNVALLNLITDIVVIPAAAWGCDGQELLYIGKYKAGTMFSDKLTGQVDPDNFVQVPTIDFAKFVKAHFDREDEIWLKLNVEGAEYEIISHLHEHDLIDWFDRIYVRWHAYKIPSLQKEHDRVAAMVPNAVPIWRKKEMLPL